MDFQEFVKKQNGIYERMRTLDKEKVAQEGIARGFKDQGGYLIIGRHSPDVTEQIEEFASKIASKVPGLAYGSHNLHTTFADYQLTPLGEFKPNAKLLEKLCDIVNAETVEFNFQPKINYGGNWLYSQDSLILAGQPDEIFVSLASQIEATGKTENIALRLPWGAHSTAVRFTEQRSPEQLTEFFQLMENAPEIPKSTIRQIDVGYFKMSPAGFNITIYDRFDI
jgi:hypothetical protein